MVRPCSRAARSECTVDRSTPCRGNSTPRPAWISARTRSTLLARISAVPLRYGRNGRVARCRPDSRQPKVGAAKSPTGSRRSESADFFEGHSEEIDHLARQPFHPGASLLKNSNSASGPMTQRFIIRRHLDWIGNPIKSLRRSPSIEHSTKHRKMHRASKWTRETADALPDRRGDIERWRPILKMPGRVRDNGTGP